MHNCICRRRWFPSRPRQRAINKDNCMIVKRSKHIILTFIESLPLVNVFTKAHAISTKRSTTLFELLTNETNKYYPQSVYHWLDIFVFTSNCLNRINCRCSFTTDIDYMWQCSITVVNNTRNIGNLCSERTRPKKRIWNAQIVRTIRKFQNMCTSVILILIRGRRFENKWLKLSNFHFSNSSAISFLVVYTLLISFCNYSAE